MTTATVPTLALNNGVEMPALGPGVFQSPPEETTSAVEAATAPNSSDLDALRERGIGLAYATAG
jgi:hypothetical protein